MSTFTHSKWRVPWKCVGDMLGHVMYPSHIISSSTYPSQVHLNDKSCTLNFRYSGTPNIPSLLFSFEGNSCDVFDEYFKEHYGNHTGITTPPVFRELPLPRPKCSSHDHPCLASCSKAARYAARAKPRNAGWNIYWQLWMWFISKKKSGAVPGSQGLVVRSHILHTFWRWRRFIKKHWHLWLPPASWNLHTLQKWSKRDSTPSPYIYLLWYILKYWYTGRI